MVVEIYIGCIFIFPHYMLLRMSLAMWEFKQNCIKAYNLNKFIGNILFKFRGDTVHLCIQQSLNWTLNANYFLNTYICETPKKLKPIQV